jgi:hypothetical protein
VPVKAIRSLTSSMSSIACMTANVSLLSATERPQGLSGPHRALLLLQLLLLLLLLWLSCQIYAIRKFSALKGSKLDRHHLLCTECLRAQALLQQVESVPASLEG